MSWWDFSVEVYRLLAGGEDEDQGSIAAGESWCYSTIPVGSVSVKTSPDVIPGGDHVAKVDTEQVEDIDEMSSYSRQLEPR